MMMNARPPRRATPREEGPPPPGVVDPPVVAVELVALQQPEQPAAAAAVVQTTDGAVNRSGAAVGAGPGQQVGNGGGDEVGGQLGIGVHGQDGVTLIHLHQQRRDDVVERARLAVGVGGHHHHLNALVGEPSGDLLGPVVRVVDDHDDPVRRLGLVQDRPDGGRETRLFVPRWDHHRNARAVLLGQVGGNSR
jgi:hypothetical protein